MSAVHPLIGPDEREKIALAAKHGTPTGEAAHSLFSASAAGRWINCPGSVVLSQGLPDRSSEYAAWGTVAHALADGALAAGADHIETSLDAVKQDGYVISVDQEMVDCVNAYLAHAAELTAGADMTWSEQRINYARWLEVPEDQAWGTLDLSAVWIEQRHLLIGDLKTGRGVPVVPDNNEQLMLYAGGKLLELDDLGIEVDTIDLAISQPRIQAAPSVWTISRDDLVAWLQGRARSGAASVVNAQHAAEVDAANPGVTPIFAETFLTPGEKQCRWCKAKATCPALRSEVFNDVTASDAGAAQPTDFEVMSPWPVTDQSPSTWISAILSKVDMIEDWCSAVRAEAHRRLTAGEPVPGYKLVAGKRGARAWADPAAAEAQLKAMRLKVEEMYDLKLITPPSAEKLAKAKVIGPRQWPKLQALITQSDGKPSVAPADDPRPALIVQPVDDAFEPQADDIC